MISLCLQERRIFDEIERAEPSTPRIERLEDDLRVVAFVKIYRHHIEETVQAGLEGLDSFRLPLDVSLAFVSYPFLDPFPEILPGTRNATTPRSAILNDAKECLPVAPRRPDLEPQVACCRSSTVESQLGELSGDRIGTMAHCHPRRSRENYLKRCQPLLSVDDEARIDATGLEMLLVEHDRPQEVPVGGVGGRVSHVPLRGVRNVVPQDTPVVVRIPDVGSLVHRDDELDAAVEKVVNGLRSGLLHPSRLRD